MNFHDVGLQLYLWYQYCVSSCTFDWTYWWNHQENTIQLETACGFWNKPSTGWSRRPHCGRHALPRWWLNLKFTDARLASCAWSTGLWSPWMDKGVHWGSLTEGWRRTETSNLCKLLRSNTEAQRWHAVLMCQRQLWLTCWKSTVWKLQSHHQPLEQVLFPKCTWLELSGIYRLFLRLKQALSPITDHWRALPWSLRSTMATVNASAAGSNTGLVWRTERSTLLWLTKECQTSHCNATSNWVLECDTDTARNGGSWSERLADDRSNCERCMVTCRTDCRQHEWWPAPESPRNCFSLAALHARRCGNIVSKLQFATRQLYSLSTTVMPE